MMAKKKVIFNIDDEINSRLKVVSKKVRVSKSELVEILLRKFVPVLEKSSDEIVPSVYLFNTKDKSFDSVGSLFHEDKK
jgi:hypothetical protein